MPETLPGFVARLEELRRTDLASAGGKGASLGEMVRAGLPVPDGFVVLTDAYRAFVCHNGLQTEIERLVGDTSARDKESAKAESRSIHGQFDAGVMPERVARAVTDAYEALGGGSVAVRSSATAEDLAGASFAGQHDSCLNIEGAKAVCAAVKRCWASLWNPQALSYRRRRGCIWTMWRWLWWCSAWRRPSGPAFCSRPTPSTIGATRCC